MDILRLKKPRKFFDHSLWRDVHTGDIVEMRDGTLLEIQHQADTNTRELARPLAVRVIVRGSEFPKRRFQGVLHIPSNFSGHSIKKTTREMREGKLPRIDLSIPQNVPVRVSIGGKTIHMLVNRLLQGEELRYAQARLPFKSRVISSHTPVWQRKRRPR